MKQYISLLFLMACSLILASCDEDSFNTVVEVDLSEYGNQMVVIAAFQPDMPYFEESQFYVRLVKSNDVLKSDDSFEIISDASVVIVEDENLQIPLTHTGSGYYLAPVDIGRPKEGTNYHIEVNSPEFGTATANSNVPKKASFKNAYISNEDYIDPSGGNEKVEITIELEDEASIENYYYLTVNSIYSNPEFGIEDSWVVCFSSSDPVFDADEYGSDFIEIEEAADVYYCGGITTFRDLLFEGESKTFKIYVDHYEIFDYSYNPDTGEEIRTRRDIQLILGSMSRDIYNYKRSARSQSWNQDNPFAEPIQVYSNIEGGVGIFGGFVETAMDLE
ncbi:MAG: DUF4249 family protein [Chitinophagales bacterium]